MSPDHLNLQGQIIFILQQLTSGCHHSFLNISFQAYDEYFTSVLQFSPFPFLVWGDVCLYYAVSFSQGKTSTLTTPKKKFEWLKK